MSPVRNSSNTARNSFRESIAKALYFLRKDF